MGRLPPVPGRLDRPPAMKTAWVAGVVAGGAAAVAVWRALGAGPEAMRPPDPTVPTATAPVRRGDVTERVEVAGTLRFGGRRVVRSQLPAGIVTAVARPGATIERGGRLFAVSGTPVLLLYGATPAYRRFHRGMADGPDVRALERNLVALGLDPFDAIVVDGHFDAATQAAVVRWQAARGVPPRARSGTVPLGRVAFLTQRVRVGRAIVPRGAPVQPGMPVVSVTSSRAVAVARVSTDQRHLIRAGSRVRVRLAGRSIRGTVTRI